MTVPILEAKTANGWKKSLQTAITDLKELLDIVELSERDRERFEEDPKFKLLVTREFVSRIRKGDSEDPLLLQIAPAKLEQKAVVGFTEDPLLECQVNPSPGLLHRYPGRVLLTLTAACPVHCRFCFRRHFPYEKNNPLKSHLEKMLQYIEQDETIEEVIYSGGDPLLVSDEILVGLNQNLMRIKHVKRLRMHTRVPIFLPSRITPQLIQVLQAVTIPISVVIHCNHPQELDEDVMHALKKLTKVAPVLNQAVLLAKINDSATILAELLKKLFVAGVLPYYLHALDKVAGAAHFAVPEEQGKKIVAELAAKVPGYLLPKYVKVVPNHNSKVHIT